MPYTDLGIEFFMVGEQGAPYNSKIDEVQDYRQIIKTQNPDNLFIDKEFPADYGSIGILRLAGPMEWKRPSEISKALFKGAAPVFIENIGEPRFDIYQGHVGDCWFLVSLADITLQKSCFDIVVPADNVSGFEAGVFHFRFWRKGTWLDVVVDDRIPCYVQDGVITSTVFLKVLTNEFWCALLEKAYAKLYGSYQRIDFGLPMEAMEDFSGGVTDYFNIISGIDFKEIMKRAYERKSFMAVGTARDTTTPEEKRRLTVEQLDNEGIVSSHAYSVLGILDVVEKASPNVKHTLIHLRNPWGNDVEWKGKWSDRDDISWATVTEDLRLGSINSEGVFTRLDGEFWMEYKDWLRKFSTLQICHWSATDHGERSINKSEIKPYSTYISNSDWTKGRKENIKNKEDLVNIPSYTVQLETIKREKADPVFDYNRTAGTCGIVVNLMYKDYNQSGIDPAIPTYGFRMLWAEGDHTKDNKLDSEYFSKAKDIFINPSTYPYGNTLAMDQHVREVTFRHELLPGTCCIIPFVEFPTSPNAPLTIPYLLRIFAEGTVICKDFKQGDETVFIPPPPTPEPPVKPIQPVTPGPGPEVVVKPDPLARARQVFKSWAGDDNLLDAAELQKVLDGLCEHELDFKGFSKQTCRSLLASVDPTGTGKIGFEQCETLMANVVQWINKFKAADLNQNGHLKNEEVDLALRSIGYNLNTFSLAQLRRKYADDFWGNYSLNTFVLLVNDLHNAVARFNNVGYNSNGFAVFNLNSWLNTIFTL